MKMVISFTKREFALSLWDGFTLLDKVTSSDAAAELMVCISHLLQTNNLEVGQLTKIGLLAGPGSFTSSRIACATCAGIKTAYHDIIIVPSLLNEALYMLEKYSAKPLLMRCNMHTWHFYDQNNWGIIDNTAAEDISRELTCVNLDEVDNLQNDILTGIAKFCDKVDDERVIKPFYGVD